MKYPYTVIFGGRWYAPGEEVPTNEEEENISNVPMAEENAGKSVARRTRLQHSQTAQGIGEDKLWKN